MRYVLGCDVGKVVDPTAIAILEQKTPQEIVELTAKRKANWLRRIAEDVGFKVHMPPVAPIYLVGLDRLPLGTKYPEQADFIVDLLSRPPLFENCELVVDATGVGIPFLDILEERGLSPIGVTIHGGGNTTIVDNDKRYRVAKADLIAVSQLALQMRAVATVDGLKLWTTLKREFLAYQHKKPANTTHDTFNAREGEHDDMVLAFAIAMWRLRAGGRVLITGIGDLGPDFHKIIEDERAQYNAIGLQHPIDLAAADMKAEMQKQAERRALEARLEVTHEDLTAREMLRRRLKGK